MVDIKTLLDMKESALQSIAQLESSAIGAPPEILSIIDKMLQVARSNIQCTDIALACQRLADNAHRRVA